MMMDRGLVRVLTNLGPQPVQFEVPEGYRLIAQSQPEIGVTEATIFLPPNSLAILSSEEN
jgi:hypothetical protein